MKVNPVNEEKVLLVQPAPPQKLAQASNLASLSRSRPQRREKKTPFSRLLKRVIDGKTWMFIMSAVTLFALFGVSSIAIKICVG